MQPLPETGMPWNTGSARSALGRAIAIACLLAFPWSAPLAKEDAPAASANDINSLPWQVGPFKGPVGEKATLAVPEGSRYLASGKSDKFFELTGNLPRPGASVLVGDHWFAVFGFADSGYIKDDEKLDADALLKSMKESDGPANEERAKRGLPKIYTDGWLVPPHYDAQTKRLEWGVRLHEENQNEPVANYTVRVLGRTGYESVILVVDPARLDASVQELRTVLKDFEFNSGERYDEFKAGDKVAEYGLGALILGGAAAAAVKTGFWKVLVGGLVAGWKFVLAGLVAVGAAVRKIFKGKAAE